MPVRLRGAIRWLDLLLQWRPLWAGFAYDHLGMTVPFFTSAVLVGGTILIGLGVDDGRKGPAPVTPRDGDAESPELAS